MYTWAFCYLNSAVLDDARRVQTSRELQLSSRSIRKSFSIIECLLFLLQQQRLESELTLLLNQFIKLIFQGFYGLLTIYCWFCRHPTWYLKQQTCLRKFMKKCLRSEMIDGIALERFLSCFSIEFVIIICGLENLDKLIQLITNWINIRIRSPVTGQLCSHR